MEWPWVFWNPSYSTSLFVMKLLIFRLVIYYAFTPMALPKHRISEKEEFGLSRLKSELIQYRELDPESLNQKIIQDLNKFSTQDLDRDDLTLLTIKRV